MRAVAQLAAEPFNADTDNGSQHVINHFNGHRILKRLITNDVERMKDTQQTGKSFMLLNFCIHCDFNEELHYLYRAIYSSRIYLTNWHIFQALELFCIHCQFNEEPHNLYSTFSGFADKYSTI